MVDPNHALIDLLAPIVQAAGADLYDVVRESGKLSVLVDRDPPIDLDAVASLSREVSAALDDADLIPGAYTLEVSSPGLERPLRTPHHFAQAIGEQVTVRLKHKIDDARRIAGTLVAADETSATVQPDDADAPRSFPLDAVQRARTIFVWERSDGRERAEHPLSDRKATQS